MPQVVSQKWAAEHVGQKSFSQSTLPMMLQLGRQSSYVKHVVYVLVAVAEDSEVVV
jgi:hypothetical protein